MRRSSDAMTAGIDARLEDCQQSCLAHDLRDRERLLLYSVLTEKEGALQQ